MTAAQLDLFFHLPKPEPVHLERVGLVACGKSKLPRANPAAELYTGQLFRKALAYALHTCDRVYILSAKYGVVAPDTVLEPYDETLVGRRKGELTAWGERTARQVLELAPPPAELLLLAGSAYVDALHGPLLSADRYRYSTPLAGQGIGEQLAWLTEALAELEEDDERPPGGRRCASCVSDMQPGEDWVESVVGRDRNGCVLFHLECRGCNEYRRAEGQLVEPTAEECDACGHPVGRTRDHKAPDCGRRLVWSGGRLVDAPPGATSVILCGCRGERHERAQCERWRAAGQCEGPGCCRLASHPLAWPGPQWSWQRTREPNAVTAHVDEVPTGECRKCGHPEYGHWILTNGARAGCVEGCGCLWFEPAPQGTGSGAAPEGG